MQKTITSSQDCRGQVSESLFFPTFCDKIFNHTPKLKEIYSRHPCTCLVKSTISTLLTSLIIYTIYLSLYSPIYLTFRCIFRRFTDIGGLPYLSEVGFKLPKDLTHAWIIIINVTLRILVASSHYLCHDEW